MAGLSREGFTPLTYAEIKTRIEGKLESFSSGIDLSAEAPDGHLVDTFSFELSEAWAAFDTIYDSGNPLLAVGAGLRNIGLITGQPYGAATRANTMLDLVGTTGTVVPQNSKVSDADGNVFITEISGVIPAAVRVTAEVSGILTMPIGTVTTIDTPVTGWDSVDQPAAGIDGKLAQTEVEFRNTRNQTVLSSFKSVPEVIKSKLIDLGVEQVTIGNNTSLVNLADGTPPGSIHVAIGEAPNVTDAQIALTILQTMGLGTRTFGTTAVVVKDDQGIDHTINFTKATGVEVFFNLNITYLDDDFAGADEQIQLALQTHINSLLAGEDVVWSRMFGIITPFGKAQVNTLEIGRTEPAATEANLVINDNEFTQLTNLSQIVIVVTN